MMIVLALLLAQAAPDPAIETRGAEIFARTCAVAYCHGPGGGPGRAPRLAGRPLDPLVLRHTVTNGIRGTSMPGFRKTLGEDGLNAVIAYVMKISIPAPAGLAPAERAVTRRPPEIEAGRELFFDASRLPSCGTCHLLDGWGVSIGPDLAKVRVSDAASLARVLQRLVKTAQPAGEGPFPALLHGKADDAITVYDLSSPLPVLRSFPPSEVTIKEGAVWSHEAVTKTYSQKELKSILGYLNWLAR